MTEPSSSSVWRGETFLRCTQRRQETSDAVTFVLVSDPPALFDYEPGQFILLTVEIDGTAYQRAYSLSSSPTRPQTLEMTVRRVEGGIVSSWLLDHFEAGGSLKASAPMGSFCMPRACVAHDLYFFSGGSGITPLMSMSRWLLDSGCSSTIHFIHSARDRDSVIFRDELEKMAADNANFSLELVLEQPGSGAMGDPVRLTKESLARLVPAISSAQAYVCGSQGYMDCVTQWLLELGFPSDQIFKESFTSAVAAEAQKGAEVWSVRVPALDKMVRIAKGQSLLDAMEQEGVPIIGACRSGICGSCKCKVISGTVASTSYETLSEEERASGYVLACSTVAESDLSVEI